MPRYTDVDLLLENIKDGVVFTARDKKSPELRGARKIINEIKNAPITDVVEITRCNDCKYLLKDLSEKQAHLCMKNPFCRMNVKLDDFCSFGKKEGE